MDDHMLQDRAACEAALSERLRVWFEQHFRGADRRLHDLLPRAFARQAPA
jgi:hypothetical protein